MKLWPFLALILPNSAQASDMRCMPDKICVPGNCDLQIDEGAAVRLTNLETAAPTLHTHKEIISMNKTFEHRGVSEWNGVNATGEIEELYFDRKWMRFKYSIRAEQVRYVAYGPCEVQ